MQSAVSSARWLALSQAGRQGIQFATSILLARLLAPSDFGVLGMALVVINFAMLFRDMGISAAIVQRKEISEQMISSLFWVNMLVGFTAMALLWLIAPLAASFYIEPRMVPIVRALSLNFVLSASSGMHQSLLERKLDFDRLARMELAASLFGAVIAIGAALFHAGVWSLVYQSLGMMALTTISLWTMAEWRPYIVLEWSEFKSVSNFSLHLVGFNLLNYCARNLDYLLIGKLLGATALGYYTYAYRIMLYPLQNVSAVVGRVMFPVYSKLQNNNTILRENYLKTVSTIALITFPMMLGLIGVREQLVLGVFGPQWQAIQPLILILAPVGLIQSIGTTVGPIFQAKGRTDLMMRWGLVAASLTVLAFVGGLRWGLTGIALAYAMISLILAYPGFAIPFKLIGLSVHKLGPALWRPLLCSILMLGAVLGLATILPDRLTDVQEMIVLVVSGITVYLAASCTINGEQIRRVATLVWSGGSVSQASLG